MSKQIVVIESFKHVFDCDVDRSIFKAKYYGSNGREPKPLSTLFDKGKDKEINPLSKDHYTIVVSVGQNVLQNKILKRVGIIINALYYNA